MALSGSNNKPKSDNTQDNEMTYIVALTSYTNSKIKQECMEAGIKKVINKPITLHTLNEIMWEYYFLNNDNEESNI